jgi:hypothetical protein
MATIAIWVQANLRRPNVSFGFQVRLRGELSTNLFNTIRSLTEGFEIQRN